MTLQLNEPVQIYQEFYGKDIEQMPLLIAQGGIPLSVADLMERRLKAVGNKELKEGWCDNYFDTGDGIAYHPDGRFKIVLGKNPVWAITQYHRRVDGAMVLEPGVYETLQGPEFKRDSCGEVQRALSRREVKKHPVWKALARNDRALLDRYTDFVFDDTKERFDYDENMGVYLMDQKDTPNIRLVSLYRFYHGSEAGAWADLDIDRGRLVSVAIRVAPEAQRVVQKAPVQLSVPSLDARIQSALSEGRAFDFNGTIYAPIGTQSRIRL